VLEEDAERRLRITAVTRPATPTHRRRPHNPDLNPAPAPRHPQRVRQSLAVLAGRVMRWLR
jgi:hypothetical protein